MGITPAAYSRSAISTGSIRVAGTSIKMGAPRESCNALAPSSRALSNRVYSSDSGSGPEEPGVTTSPLGAAGKAAAVKGAPTRGTVFTVCYA